MPPKKGRKRRARDRRHDEPGEPRAVDVEAASPSHEEMQRPAPPSDLPKLRVRMIGFVLGVITMFFGVLNVKAGLDEGSIPILVTGVLLIALSLVLGVLSLVPERVRALLSRK